VTMDRRDNPVAATRGTFLTGDVELAARAIGSQVGFVKTFIQGSAFRRLDASGRTVLAGQVQFGEARGFPRVALVPDDNGDLVETTVEDIPASQRFFAGGSTSVRGYRTDRLAVPELLNADGLPLGGNALVVFNAEIRRVVGRLFGRNLGAVGFVDSGNVFKRASDLSLADLESSVGVGVRYDTPFGAVRLDFGFKVKPPTVGGARQRGWEYHLNIGEAF
jgi:outer membrane translocation and assembly module TamA